MKINIDLPSEVKFILSVLEKNNFTAHIVGGCVRDSLIGRPVNDWDITTSALPEEVMGLFNETIPMGIKFGMVVVIVNGKEFEVTTHRVDGESSDNRHPDKVFFSKNIEEDLKRRDFTINAMAFSERDGLIDLFNGQEDLKNKIIKTVGNPNDRFNEDALRIMRAIRFSAQLGFSIEKNTLNAINSFNKEIFKSISKERINKELTKIIIADSNKLILLKNIFRKDLDILIPQISTTFNFNQNNPHHNLDLFNHTIQAMNNVPSDIILKLTMLFHDIAKPLVVEKDTRGISHFKGHAEKSAEIAENILSEMRFTKKIIKEVVTLIKFHDIQVPKTKKSLIRLINKIGIDRIQNLIIVKKADILAQSTFKQKEKLLDLKVMEDCFCEVKNSKNIPSLKTLKINGNDLIKEGFKGKEIGIILNNLLGKVINGDIKNDKNELLTELKKKS